MVFNRFKLKTDQEIGKEIDEWFFDLEYLAKIRILLRVYPKLNITKIESQGIDILWKKISLERKKDLYQDNWKY